MSPSIARKSTGKKSLHVKIEDDPVALDLFRNSQITIGTDLEITLHPYFDRLSAVTGLSFWDTGKEGKVGTDGKTKFFQYLVELRPDYAWDGRALLDNVIALVAREIKSRPNLKNYLWKGGTGDFNHKPVDNPGGAYYLPKGGHIHFGSVELQESFIYAMDLLLAPIVLVLEDPVRAMMRRAVKFDFNGGTYYGQLGGWRASQHAPTWEYRTLPNFCINYVLSESIFNIAKAIVFECMENKAFIRSLKSKINNLKPDILTFNFCRKEYYRPKIEKIFAILSKLRMLDNKYGKDLLARLRRYIYNNDTWNLGCDMLVDFKICDPVKLFKERIESIGSTTIPAEVLNKLEKTKAAHKNPAGKNLAAALAGDPGLLQLLHGLLKDLSKCNIEIMETVNNKLGKQQLSTKIDKLLSYFFSRGGEAYMELDRLYGRLKNTAAGKSIDINELKMNIDNSLSCVNTSSLIF